jgi:hypothetical protein
MNTFVFVGPTLARDEAARLLPDATLLPPARQGDVMRAIRDHRPSAVGLIDGAFLDVPAVWHREILWALNQGIPVLGAASMGALRAAELHSFGMTGVGRIFEAYRDGHLEGWDDAFEDDDEVAVIHAPTEAGGFPLSDAMVDLRDTLARAEAAGIIGRATRDDLARRLKEQHFPQRSLAGLIAISTETGETELAAWLPANHASLKAADARLMLQKLAHDLPAPAPPRMERALVWEAFLKTPATETSDEAAVLAALARDRAAWDATARDALCRQSALDAIENEGDAEAALTRFREIRGLYRQSDLVAWTVSNQVQAGDLERLLRDEQKLDRQTANWPQRHLRRAMLDVLRLSGRYARLGRELEP